MRGTEVARLYFSPVRAVGPVLPLPISPSHRTTIATLRDFGPVVSTLINKFGYFKK
jgi:hypothetical protein